jgi:hypothetical protein
MASRFHRQDQAFLLQLFPGSLAGKDVLLVPAVTAVAIAAPKGGPPLAGQA